MRRTVGVAAAAMLVGLSLLVPEQGRADQASCPLLVAHRGGVPSNDPLIAENSMAGFRRAVAAGAAALETDVRFTKDGRAVLMHDRMLDRTTTGTGTVAARSLAQVRELRLVADPLGVRTVTGSRVPTLKGLLTFAREHAITVFAEFKDPPTRRRIRRYDRVIRQSGADVVVASFARRVLRSMQRIDPARPRMWFHTDAMPDAAAAPGSADIGIRNTGVNTNLVADLAAAGVRTNAWFSADVGGDSATGNAAGPGWEALAAAGVSSITTDYPQAYRSWAAATTVCADRANA